MLPTVTSIEYSSCSSQQPLSGFCYSSEELVYLAVERLSSLNIKLTEFRSMLYRRMNVPLMIINFTFLVEDELIINASSALVDLGLLIVQPADFIYRTQGDFMRKGNIHQVFRSNKPGQISYLVLLPSSFASFTPDDLCPTPLLPPDDSTLPRKPIDILYPRPSSVYAFFFRTLARYPPGGATRCQLLSDLSQLILYDMYAAQGFNEEFEEDEEEFNAEDDPQIQSALDRVRGWSKAGEWRQGEEWIADCLGVVLEGKGYLDCTPWAPGAKDVRAAGET